MKKTPRIITAVLLTGLVGIAACEDRTEEQVQEAGREAGEAARAVGEEAARETREAAGEAERALERAGERTERGLERAGEEIEEGWERTRAGFDERKDAFLTSTREELTELDKKMQDLDARARSQGKAMRRDLVEARARVGRELDSAAQSTEQTWDRSKQNLDQAMDDLRDAVRAADRELGDAT